MASRWGDAMDAGRVVLHYRIGEKIGQGGMGEVYRAEDLKLGRPVAIKVLAPDAAADPTAKLRLVREARSASALNHPNIVTIYAIEEVEASTFLVMEFIAGQTLSSLLKGETLPFPRLLDIALQASEAWGGARGRHRASRSQAERQWTAKLPATQRECTARPHSPGCRESGPVGREVRGQRCCRCPRRAAERGQEERAAERARVRPD